MTHIKFVIALVGMFLAAAPLPQPDPRPVRTGDRIEIVGLSGGGPVSGKLATYSA